MSRWGSEEDVVFKANACFKQLSRYLPWLTGYMSLVIRLWEHHTFCRQILIASSLPFHLAAVYRINKTVWYMNECHVKILCQKLLTDGCGKMYFCLQECLHVNVKIGIDLYTFLLFGMGCHYFTSELLNKFQSILNINIKIGHQVILKSMRLCLVIQAFVA